ncbi:MAG: ribose 5-phosphate isomerase A [Alphaproteobacteria bacterium]|nr:ribose 5-phosphate isomerase A [Alphaproteobacteria bacterium]
MHDWMHSSMTDLLAAAAVEPIVTGMIVGLGTGRAATRGIRALGARAAAERLELRCVATSDASARLAASLGLRVEDLQAVGSIDYLFDGADEVDADLRMIKGRGGAMTREKLVAHASRRRVYLIQSDKLVQRLGEKALLPVEVTPDHLEAVRGALNAHGLPSDERRTKDGSAYRTDSGNPVLDATLGSGIDVSDLATALDKMAGVVGHGLFLTEADLVLIEDETGKLSRRARPAP